MTMYKLTGVRKRFESLTKDDFIQWFARINLVTWFAILFTRAALVVYRLHQAVMVVDEPLTFNLVENVWRHLRFTDGPLPGTVNFNPDVPVRFYWQYAFEAILRSPFHILYELTDRIWVTRLAPLFYLILLFLVFAPKLMKRENEELALFVGFSLAILATVDAVPNAFFRVRYFPFLYMAVFTSLVGFSYLNIKPLVLKSTVAMFVLSVVPLLFHSLGGALTVAVFAMLALKAAQYVMINRAKVVCYVKSGSKPLLVLVFSLPVLIFALLTYAAYYAFFRWGFGFTLGAFDTDLMIRHFHTFTSREFYGIIGYLILIAFLFLACRNFSPFLRSMYFVSLCSLVVLAISAFVTGDVRFGFSRYLVVGLVQMSVMTAIFFTVMMKCLVHNISFPKKGKFLQRIVYLTNLRINTVLIFTAVLAVIYLHVTTAPHNATHYQLPIDFNFAASLKRGGTYGISPHNIQPERLFIITDRQAHAVMHFPHVRIFNSRNYSELELGESDGFNFRHSNGWTYNWHGTRLLASMSDFNRMLVEIEAPAESYISFNIAMNRIRSCLREMLSILSLPNNFTPVPVSVIVASMHANGFYVPEMLRKFIESH